MRHITRTVTTKRTIDGEAKKVEFEVQVPQFDSDSEFFESAGGNEPGLKFINGGVATGAVNGARAFARSAPESMSIDDIVSKARDIAAGYQPSGIERGMSRKAKAEAFDSLMARFNSDNPPSEDELQELAGKYAS